MSALGADPNAWERLRDEELAELALFKCLEYGITADAKLISPLFALYKFAIGRFEPSRRLRGV